MTNYRRNRLPGGTYFFTVAIAQRHLDILVQHVRHLKAALRDEHQRAPSINLALVVLPDHLHAIWRLPQEDSDYSNRWRRIKAGFSRALPLGERVSTSREMKGERGTWQRRFWEHTVRDEEDLQHHLDYIHFNPVKHGLVSRVSDWPHSTFHEYVRRGLYASDWGGCNDLLDKDFGE
ncbi:MAG: transposase [Syntrophobacteraceae bacterium]|jgi:putative transposase